MLTTSRDDLTLDGTPTLNLASFVTTYMVCFSCLTYYVA